ncbi:hypothetical protein FOA52_005220 [Chlamydomonas sp. UWO 241]|nr:hypothetical protein FOA52_005220 [Chlamydomonas sp. UWO 241]
MCRKSASAWGFAHLVVEALIFSGQGDFFKQQRDVLDWGGSNGRIAMMFKAAYPNIQSHVADPIHKSA